MYGKNESAVIWIGHWQYVLKILKIKSLLDTFSLFSYFSLSALFLSLKAKFLLISFSYLCFSFISSYSLFDLPQSFSQAHHITETILTSVAAVCSSVCSHFLRVPSMWRMKSSLLSTNQTFIHSEEVGLYPPSRSDTFFLICTKA